MPPGWLKREYRPDGPLYARRRLVFSGVVVERDALIPAESIRSKVKHQRLWQTNQAGHEPRDRSARKPYGRPLPPAPTALPAVTVQPDTFTSPGFTAGGSIVVATTSDDRALLATDSQRVAFKVALGETVPVPPPQPTGRHKRR